MHIASDGGWLEPECGINCISEALSEATQDDVYGKLDVACPALVTASRGLWNADSTHHSSFLHREQALGRTRAPRERGRSWAARVVQGPGAAVA